MRYDDIKEYGEHGRVKHCTSAVGAYEFFLDYDASGHLTHIRHITGEEAFWSRDEKNCLTSIRLSDGYSAKFEYNEQDEVVHFVNSKGFEWRFERLSPALTHRYYADPRFDEWYYNGERISTAEGLARRDNRPYTPSPPTKHKPR